MIPKRLYIENLNIVKKIKLLDGAIVECGVWRGGMIAGIAEFLGNDRDYFLFDSFEGLPEAKEIDGNDALKWQNDKTSKFYYDNCKAEIKFAQQALSMSGTSSHSIVAGWFSETMPTINIDKGIALLRLDSDWYESTYQCLQYLFPLVVKDGIIIIDDYFTWDGCTKAVHAYLFKNNRSERISQFNNSVAYIIKK